MVPNYHLHARALAEIDKQYDYGLIDELDHAEAVSEVSGVPIETIRSNIRSTHQRNELLLRYAQQLRPRYKLGMLSNIGRGGMESFFSSTEQAELFDDVVLSGEVMMTKPSPEVFSLAATRLEVSTHECVMIDDKRENVDGALQAGMSAVLFISNEQLRRALAKMGLHR